MPPSLPQGFNWKKLLEVRIKRVQRPAPAGAGDRLKASLEVLTRVGIITQIKEPLVFLWTVSPGAPSKRAGGLPPAVLPSVHSGRGQKQA